MNDVRYAATLLELFSRQMGESSQAEIINSTVEISMELENEMYRDSEGEEQYLDYTTLKNKFTATCSMEGARLSIEHEGEYFITFRMSF